MTRMGLVQGASLFTRGAESVRIVRIRQTGGQHHVLVNGPGAETMQHHVKDAAECASQEAELERRLVAKGFRLERFDSGNRRLRSDRRTVARGPDRRVHLERVV